MVSFCGVMTASGLLTLPFLRKQEEKTTNRTAPINRIFFIVCVFSIEMTRMIPSLSTRYEARLDLHPLKIFRTCADLKVALGDAEVGFGIAR